MPLHPTVLWAQRADVLYVTVEVFDIEKPEIHIDNQKFSFKGISKESNQEYAVELEFYGEIDPEKSKQHLTARNLQMVIYKKGGESAGYWPRLLKSSQKVNFLKTDFAKWKDEDDDDEEDVNPADQFGGMDFSSLMANAGAGGLPGMEGLEVCT
ncbi:HSP20-like chaperone [Umbelopsis sp. PMI_123]|nr:HSP20-like chaperone [Umbelopsis sp. PMI_123]